jgi:hypothetical protein
MKSIPEKAKNGLFKLSGEDYNIISECSGKIQFYYALIGFLVLLILLFSFASALYFTEQLFNNVLADIGVGIIWGYIVTNMYVLLLYTISPALLPIKERKNQEIKTKQFELSFSMILRIFVVILLAIIIAQPLNVLFLKPNSSALAFDIKYLLATNPFATINTLIVIAIFLLPIHLKYSIRNFGKFYEIKAEIEKQIIENDYKEFKDKYRRLLENNNFKFNESVWTNLTTLLNRLQEINPKAYQRHFKEISGELAIEKFEKYEYWSDPPFRTIRKAKTKNVLSEKDLINFLYPETD